MVRIWKYVFLLVCSLTFAACGGKIDDDNRADAGAPPVAAPAEPAEPVRELTCHGADDEGNRVDYPCPGKVYDGFGLPRPPGLEDDESIDAGQSDDENVDSSSQALGGDAFCTSAQASNGAPPCCHGADYCYVDGGQFVGIKVWRCPATGLFGPSYCFESPAVGAYATSNQIELMGWRNQACVAMTIPAQYAVNYRCNLTRIFGDMTILSAGTRTLKVRPNRGETIFFNTQNNYYSGAYACGVHRSILPSSSCP